MSFKFLRNRKIIDILIGDQKVTDEYSLPYLSGPKLCELSTTFGLVRTYTWGNGASNYSRWEYMSDLLGYLDKQSRIPELLAYLLKLEHFDYLINLGDPAKIHETHKLIVLGTIKSINANLMFAGKELRIINKAFIIVDIGSDVSLEVPKIKVVTSEYIKELPERIKDDLENMNYDSVITKSRTLLEEVFIYIIERLTHERYKSKGDLIKIYQEVTALLNMRQSREWDARVNELLGGLHKLVSAISSMRNINSDAHGAGSGRFGIRKREAVLVAYSSMLLAEYILSVYENRD